MMTKYIIIILITVSSFLTSDTYSQNNWKTNWSNTLTILDSMLFRERLQFRTMQNYQNDATEELILKDIDSLIVFAADVNSHIDLCNNFKFPFDTDALNASETFNLKISALKEYYDQCRLQIHVNNNILQKRLKNEFLDFKVRQIDDIKLNNYTPILQ